MRSVKLAFLTAATLAFIACSRQVTPSPVEVRLQNATGRDMAEVIVEKSSFGAVRSGVSSPYQQLPFLHQDPTVFTTEPNGYFRNHKVVQDPKGMLGRGRYTITLSLTGDESLQVQVKQDQ